MNRLPITARGACFAATVLALLGLGVLWADLVLFAAALALAFCWLGLGLLVLLVGPLLSRVVAAQARACACLQLVVGQPSDTGFTLRLPAYLPLLTLDWQVEGCSVVSQSRHGYLREQLTGERRGAFSSQLRHFQVGDCLGLFRYRWLHRSDAELRILPSLGQAPANLVAQAWRAGSDLPTPAGPEGDSLTEIRQYRPGDPFRHILWTLYARTQKLMVRVTEPAISRDYGLCIYLLTDPGDEAAAAIARGLIENLEGPQWRFGADGMPGYTSSPSLALRWLCEAPTSAGLDLGRFLEEARADGYARCVTLAKQGSDKVAEAHRLGLYSPIETVVIEA